MLKLIPKFCFTIFIFISFATVELLAQDQIERSFELNNEILKDKIISRGESYSIILEAENKKDLYIQDIILDGSLEIVINNSSDKKSIVYIENIRGNGSIIIRGEGLVSLELGKIQCNSFFISLNEIDEIRHTFGRVEIAQFQLDINELKTLTMGPGIFINEFDIKVTRSADTIQINDYMGEKIRIEGDGKGLTRIEKCNISLAPEFEKSLDSRIRIASSGIGSMKIENASGILQNANHQISYDIFVEDILIFGQKLLLSLDGLQVRDIEVRNVTFGPKSFSSLRIQKNNSQSIKCFLALSGIKNLYSLDIKWLSGFESFITNNIDVYEISLDINEVELEDLTRVEIGGLHVKDGIDAPKNVLLKLASLNRTNRPFDRFNFYSLIERVGFYEKNGVTERPGLEALRLAQLSKINERGSGGQITGLMIYVLTGFGTTIKPPLLTWFIMVLISALTYFILLLKPSINVSDNSNGNIVIGKLWCSITLSFTSAIKFGGGSKDFVENNLSVKYDKIPLQTILVFIRFQSVFSLIQLTLCSIFFSQTTLR